MHTGKFVHDAIHDPKGTAEKLLTQTKDTLAVMAKISFALDDLSGEIPQQYSNPEKTANEFKEYAEKLVAVIGKEWKETDRYKITKAVFKFFSSAYVDGEKFAVIGRFSKILRKKGKIVAEDVKKLFTRTSKKVVDTIKNPSLINSVTEGFVAPNGVVKEVEKDVAKVVEGIVAKGEQQVIEAEGGLAKTKVESVEVTEKTKFTQKAIELTQDPNRLAELKKYVEQLPGLTIGTNGKIIVDYGILESIYGERLAKLGLNPKLSKTFLTHIINGHYKFGVDYIIELARKGIMKSTFLSGENFIELALIALEKGKKIEGGKFIYDFGRIIGFDMMGVPTTKIKVVLMDSLDAIKTVFPT